MAAPPQGEVLRFGLEEGLVVPIKLFLALDPFALRLRQLRLDRGFFLGVFLGGAFVDLVQPALERSALVLQGGTGELQSLERVSARLDDTS